MDKKTKVLIVTDRLNIGGYDIVAYNLQKNLNKDKFECTYSVRGDEIGLLEEDVRSSGVRIIHQPDSQKGYLKSYFYFKRLFTENEFDVVHSHLTFYSGIVMRAAYKAGVKRRFPHSHFTDPCRPPEPKYVTFLLDCYRNLMRRWLYKYSTKLIACGKEAGEFLYGKKAFGEKGVLINNGVYTDDFAFSREKRRRIREEFALGDKTVLGHVGRLNFIKNHHYLIDIFHAYHEAYPDSALMIVGEGDLYADLKKQTEELGIADSVIFTGLRSDIPDLLCAMDCFVFPSFKEGFPLTLVEAQASGLSCIISDTVTRSAKINANVAYESIQALPSDWVEEIHSLSMTDRESVDLTSLLERFDIKKCSESLEKVFSGEDE